MSRFFLMPEGQYIHHIVGRLMSIQRDVAGIPERYHQFAQLRHLRERATNFRRFLQQKDLPSDSITGPLGSFRGFPRKEPPTSRQPNGCTLRYNYLWQSGIAFSSSVPQVFSQVRTSWPVKCWPVSL